MSALGRTVLVASLLLYPFVDRALGWQTVHAVSDGMIYVLLALGLNIVVGYAGLLDLGYAAFFAIGAYTSALLMTQAHWNFFTTLPFAVLFTGTAGAILGYPTLRLRSDYLAIVTLGFGHMTRLKLFAYVMGGMWGGLAGAFFATRIGAIDPTSFTFQLSVLILIVIVLGGTGSLPGVLLGALVVVALPEVLRELSDVRLLVFAILLVGMMLLRPQGLWPRIRRTPKPFYGLEEEEAEDTAARILREHQVQMEERDLRHVAGGHKVPAAGEVLLQVEGVVQQFGGLRAVDNVSFNVRRGEIFSIIGPNGGGKTTLFNCITGVQRPKRGQVLFDGRPVVGLRPHVIVARGIGRTFQGIRLFKNMAVFENVMVGLYPRHRTMTWQAMLHTPGERKDELRTLQESRRWLSFVGLESVAGRLATELSYADQRRVEIARALAGHPQLGLVDAPAAGMHPAQKAELVAIIRKIRDLGITIVLIEHDMSLVMRVSDRIAVLDHGVLIALGKPAEIQNNPAVIEAYLGREDDDIGTLAAQEA